METIVHSLADTSTVDQRVHDFLVSSIDADLGLLDSLVKSGTMSSAEANEVNDIGDVQARNQKILELTVGRGHIQQLTSALLENNQSHLITLLTSGGIVVRIYVSIIKGFPDAKEAAEEIVMKVRGHLRGQSIDEVSEMTPLLGLGLIGATTGGQQIVLCFHAKTLSELVDLHDALAKGQLRSDVNALFVELVTGAQEETTVMLDWKREDYQREKLYFSGFHVEEGRSKTVVDDLPVGLRRMIVVKAYISIFLNNDHEVNRHPEAGIFTSLSSVSRSWHEMIYTQIFKHLLSCYLSAYFERTGRRSAIVRNNRYYLSWHVTPKGLIDRLHHAECLTDEDTRFIKCQTYDHDKIDEVLSVVWDLSIEKYAVYVESLRLTNQHLAADIAETGGVTVKCKSINDEATNDLEQMELRIVERLNHIRDKKMQRSDEVEGIVDMFGRNGIEILGSSHDHGIVVWFWCRSEQALEKLRLYTENDEIDGVLEEFFAKVGRWCSPPVEGPIKPDFVIIDGWQFHRDVVVLPMQLHFGSSLRLNPDSGPALGVAALPRRFFVLHQKSIAVYRGEDGFDLSGEIASHDFGSLSDIVACAKSQCLYVTDRDHSCIWKIALEDQKTAKWISNISLPYTCSVSSAGDVLTLRAGSPSVLEVYGPDATLQQKVTLPAYVRNPRLAVETRGGNFEVLAEEALIETTKNGLVVRRHKSYSEADPLKAAAYMALDSAERVYVTEGNRILLFDSQLCLNHEILGGNVWSAAEVVDPRQLCHVEKMQFLIVHSQGRKVDVYNLRSKD